MRQATVLLMHYRSRDCDVLVFVVDSIFVRIGSLVSTNNIYDFTLQSSPPGHIFNDIHQITFVVLLYRDW